MKITICGSMAFSKEMVNAKKYLENNGHKVVLPRNTEHYADESLKPESRKESADNKINHNLIKYNFETIKDCEVILVINITKNGINNYIGGNTLIEMAFAHILDKKIFLLNPIPQMNYSDEIISLQPTILNGDLTKII